MRQKLPVVVSLTVLSIILFFTRHHIANLGEVVRQYATFHKLVQNHPELLYHYNPATSTGSVVEEKFGEGQQVSKILHQVFLSSEASNSSSVPSKYSAGLASCQDLHPEWEHMLWTRANASAFMHDHYPALAPHYESYVQNIQRANILRYALLHHYGGVYLDLDITCLAPLDNLLHLPWLTPGAYPAGVNNAFIATRPRHKLLEKLIQDAPSRDLKWPLPYVENMLSTGCMYFSNTWLSYVLHQLKQLRNGGMVAEEDKVYTLSTPEGDPIPHMLRGKITTPLFEHAGASSWHGWDAAAIVLIGKHYGYFAALLGGIIVLCALGIWKVVNGRPKRVRERSWLDSRVKGGLVRPFSEEEKLIGMAKEG